MHSHFPSGASVMLFIKVEQIFAFLIRDFSGFALSMVLNHRNSADQEAIFQAMIKKPARDETGFSRVWGMVYDLKDRYVVHD